MDKKVPMTDPFFSSGLHVPSLQRDYYLALSEEYRRRLSTGAGENIHVDLHDPDLRSLATLSSTERRPWMSEFDRKSLSAVDNPQKAQGGVAVLEMNAGLGTSLGLDPVRGDSKATGVTFDVVVEGKSKQISILEAKLLWYLRHRSWFERLAIIPWNSPTTRVSWDRVVDRKEFEAGGIVLLDHCLQYPFPRFCAGTIEPFMGGRPEDRVAPGGHGQILYQLYGDGTLERLVRDGFEVLVLVNSDNIAATPHPAMVKLLLEASIPAAMVTTDRTQEDIKGGILAVRGDHLVLVERAQVRRQDFATFEAIGLRKGDSKQPFNTNTIYINIQRFLEVIGDDRNRLLPDLIVNHKKVGKEDVVQLEGAIGSVILRLSGVKLFNVPASLRHTQFIPIKTPADVDRFYRSGKFAFDIEKGEFQVSDAFSGGCFVKRGFS